MPLAHIRADGVDHPANRVAAKHAGGRGLLAGSQTDDVEEDRHLSRPAENPESSVLSEPSGSSGSIMTLPMIVDERMFNHAARGRRAMCLHRGSLRIETQTLSAGAYLMTDRCWRIHHRGARSRSVASRTQYCTTSREPSSVSIRPSYDLRSFAPNERLPRSHGPGHDPLFSTTVWFSSP